MNENLKKFAKKQYSIKETYFRLYGLRHGLFRKRIINQYLKNHPEERKLQLGCGPHTIPGWLNTDIFPVNSQIAFLDVTRKFPFEDNTFDYIFSEHIFEHVSLAGGHNMLKESFRALKPGGVLRLATPDLDFLINLHQAEPKSEVQQEYINWAYKTHLAEYKEFTGGLDTFVINNFFRDWGHQVIYDFKGLKAILEHAGFRKIERSHVKESEHEALRNMEHHDQIISEKFNLLETIVVEAQKD